MGFFNKAAVSSIETRDAGVWAGDLRIYTANRQGKAYFI
jgi:hypothetical protein